MMIQEARRCFGPKGRRQVLKIDNGHEAGEEFKGYNRAKNGKT